MKNKTKSYDAKVYIVLNRIVIKKYKQAEQIDYLNNRLMNYYNNIPKGVLPVAWHEWNALKKLYTYGLAPKPIFCGHTFIVMAYAGPTIEEVDAVNTDYEKQACKIYERLQEIGFKHNDLLPRNVCLKDGNIKLIDFTMSEFDGISIINGMPNPNWAYPGDERIISYFSKRSISDDDE